MARHWMSMIRTLSIRDLESCSRRSSLALPASLCMEGCEGRVRSSRIISGPRKQLCRMSWQMVVANLQCFQVVYEWNMPEIDARDRALNNDQKIREGMARLL